MRRSAPAPRQSIRYQKPNWAAVSFSVSAERFRAASSRSETGVLMAVLTPLRLSSVGKFFLMFVIPWISLIMVLSGWLVVY